MGSDLALSSRRSTPNAPGGPGGPGEASLVPEGATRSSLLGLHGDDDTVMAARTVRKSPIGCIGSDAASLTPT